MNYEKKFRTGEEQQLSEQLGSQSQQTIHDFATPEDMLRFDRKQTLTPGDVAEQLKRSLKNQPQVEAPWWKRLFS